MKKELDDALCRDFPILYADRHGNPAQTSMYWGFCVGDGWESLIRDLSAKLEKLIEQMSDVVCKCGHDKEQFHLYGNCSFDFRDDDETDTKDSFCLCKEYKSNRPMASQVKEKFGTLRFYMTTSTLEMGKLIDEAEELSAKTCEECGKPGNLRKKHYWVYTACDECDIKKGCNDGNV